MGAGTDLEDRRAAARAADLHYVSDEEPGLGRRRAGSGFAFLRSDGAFVRDESIKRRLRALAIPPAWTDVWISPDPDAHLLATGRDEAGRKQYIYHERWHRARQRARFEALSEFARALPSLRSAYDAELRRRTPDRSRSTALALAVLDRTYLRVGSEAHDDDEHATRGLCTLLRSDASIGSLLVTLDFTGKSGVKRHAELRSRRIASHLKRLEPIPSERLFAYLGPDGRARAVEADDVNEWIGRYAGARFSAKDFRTWGGTMSAALALLEACADPEDDGPGPGRAKRVIAAASRALGNTPAVCRGHYVHPAITAWCEGGDRDWTIPPQLDDDQHGLAPQERRALAVLDALGDGRSICAA